MKSRPNRVRGSSGDLQILTRFVLRRKKQMRLRLYLNIIAGQPRFKPPAAFFKELSAEFDRSGFRIKRLFAEYEGRLYVDTLSVPEAHFRA